MTTCSRRTWKLGGLPPTKAASEVDEPLVWVQMPSLQLFDVPPAVPVHAVIVAEARLDDAKAILTSI